MVVINKFAQQTTVVILAGGRGTRIAAMTPNTPKPMVSVAGQPFLEWIIRRLVREHFTDILLSIGHMAEVISQWMDKRPAIAAETIWAHRESQPLGTGGAIANSLPYIQKEYVLILNGDTLLLTDFLPAIKRIADEHFDGIIVARHLQDTSRYGRLVVEEGRLKQFQEKISGEGLINSGVYAFRTAWLKSQIGLGVSSLELDVFPRMLKQGAKIGIEVTKAAFIDIGTPETLAEATSFIKTHTTFFL